MALTVARERWAEALAVQREHGARAPEFIAQRVAELAIAGDFGGVARWREIAERLDALRNGTLQ